jgi:hypothetical protein
LQFDILSATIEYNAVSVENTAGRPTRNLALPFPAGLFCILRKETLLWLLVRKNSGNY